VPVVVVMPLSLRVRTTQRPGISQVYPLNQKREKGSDHQLLDDRRVDTAFLDLSLCFQIRLCGLELTY